MLHYFPPISLSKTWPKNEREKRYFDWVRVQPYFPGVPDGYYHPMFEWMVEILRMIASKDPETIRDFQNGEFNTVDDLRYYDHNNMWDRQRREREADLTNTLAIIREALEYRGEITDEMVSSYLHRIESALPYNGPMA